MKAELCAAVLLTLGLADAQAALAILNFYEEPPFHSQQLITSPGETGVAGDFEHSGGVASGSASFDTGIVEVSTTAAAGRESELTGSLSSGGLTFLRAGTFVINWVYEADIAAYTGANAATTELQMRLSGSPGGYIAPSIQLANVSSACYVPSCIVGTSLRTSGTFLASVVPSVTYTFDFQVSAAGLDGGSAGGTASAWWDAASIRPAPGSPGGSAFLAHAIAPVPESPTMVLFAIGMAAIGLNARRRFA